MQMPTKTADVRIANVDTSFDGNEFVMLLQQREAFSFRATCLESLFSF